MTQPPCHLGGTWRYRTQRRAAYSPVLLVCSDEHWESVSGLPCNARTSGRQPPPCPSAAHLHRVTLESLNARDLLGFLPFTPFRCSAGTKPVPAGDTRVEGDLLLCCHKAFSRVPPVQGHDERSRGASRTLHPAVVTTSRSPSLPPRQVTAALLFPGVVTHRAASAASAAAKMFVIPQPASPSPFLSPSPTTRQTFPSYPSLNITQRSARLHPPLPPSLPLTHLHILLFLLLHSSSAQYP